MEGRELLERFATKRREAGSRVAKDKMGLDNWLKCNFSTSTVRKWKEIRLFLSSTFIDTQAERDAIIKRVIPNVNRKLGSQCIRIVPVDLRWGVLHEESKDCKSIQKTCLANVDKCRQDVDEFPWILVLRTDRYGWVQHELMSSGDSDIPKKYEWLDKFKEYGKHVSITSLECMHASIPPKRIGNSPTVFVYKRRIKNYEDVEPELRWIFDFEHVSEDDQLEDEVRCQYNQTNDAEKYKEDKDDLDRYLENLPHVKFTEYECTYNQGRAKITGENENKRFGVGYVDDLEDFEKLVEEHLLQAVKDNFGQVKAPEVPAHVFVTDQHEQAVMSKANSFVGRKDLLRTVEQHCTSKHISNNTLLLHGAPGCGKTALLSTVAQQCFDSIRAKEGFVFVHLVGSCPGSHVLEFMLRRLHLNLTEYCGVLDNKKSTELEEARNKIVNLPAKELQQKHLELLFGCVNKFPDKLFVLLIDSLDRFSNNEIWWLPTNDLPNNLRFVITSCTDIENNNTLPSSANSNQIEIKDLPDQDRRQMIKEGLDKFNKKMTEEQLALVVGKSGSPAYLSTAMEAIRKFGVWEGLIKYIQSLPSSLVELFNFLLKELEKDYEENFLKNVVSLLCLSKYGLLENQMNDLLYFLQDNGGEKYYNSSFSRLYYSLSCFLQGGTGGMITFSHAELRNEAKKRYLELGNTINQECTDYYNLWLAKFFHHCISKQLCYAPDTDDKPAYYKECLQQIVHYELESNYTREQMGNFKNSLRNIYFIRERIVHGQQQQLQYDYRKAEQTVENDDELKALKDWATFCQFYSHHITNHPQWVHNIAMNQPRSSFVFIDTNSLEDPPNYDGYPLYWSNNDIQQSSSTEMLYQKGGKSEVFISCAASTKNLNLCVFGSKLRKFYVFEQNTGELKREIKIKDKLDVLSIYFSTQIEGMFWIGHSEGKVSLWNTSTWSEEWKGVVAIEKEDEENDDDDDDDVGGVTWIHSVDKYVLFGTSGLNTSEGIAGTIAVIDESRKSVIKRWSTDIDCYSYCFHPRSRLIYSGHDGVVKSWTLSGSHLKNIEFSHGKAVMLCPHPFEGDILIVTEKERKKYTLNQLKEKSSTLDVIVEGTGAKALYDSTGANIMCTGIGTGRKVITLYSTHDLSIKGEPKEHAEDITDIALIPGTDLIVTAARDGGRCFSNCLSGESLIEVKDCITWSAFLPDGVKFVTLSEKGTLSVWNSSSEEIIKTIRIPTARKAVLHPNGELICVCTKDKINWRKLDTLDECFELDLSLLGDDVFVNDIKLTSTGDKCILATRRHGEIVLDVSENFEMSFVVTHTSEGEVFSFDIHHNDVHVLSGSRNKMEVWDLVTNQSVFKHDGTGWPNLVKFLPELDQIIYSDMRQAQIINYTDNLTQILGTKESSQADSVEFSFDIDVDPVLSLMESGTELMSGKGRLLNIYDVTTGQSKYTFIDPDTRSTHYVSLAVNPGNSVVIVGNNVGKFYILKIR